MRRYLQAGAVWAVAFGDLPDLRARATVSGNPSVVRSPMGHALRLDGTNDYITFDKGYDENLLRFDSGCQDFSIFAWLRRDRDSQSEIIFDKRDANDDGWRFLFAADDSVLLSVDTIDEGSSGGVDDTLWHHLGATVDRDGNAQVYIDGAANGTPTAVGGEVMATTTAPVVGRTSYLSGDHFAGDIHSIVIWDRALAPAEVADLATLGAF